MRVLSMLLAVTHGSLGVLGELSHTEKLFDAVPKPESLRETLKFYTSLEHMAGTPGDYETARYTAEKFREYGIEARLDKHRGILVTAPCAATCRRHEENPAPFIKR
jgi:hypothetical protein